MFTMPYDSEVSKNTSSFAHAAIMELLFLMQKLLVYSQAELGERQTNMAIFRSTILVMHS